jgi:hypothetical protein
MMSVAYAKQCPDCGAYLDPGETCDCNDQKGGEYGEQQSHQTEG